MEAGKHIELSLGQELGEFRLNLDGITITINLKDQGRAQISLTRDIATSPPLESQPGVTTSIIRKDTQNGAELSSEVEYYRQVSQDIYKSLGKLAKDINLSFQDPSLAEIIENAMRSPNEHLDQARTQVTDVLNMTEQATMDIMDLVEQIRGDCQKVQTKLLTLVEVQAPGNTEEEEPASISDEAGTQNLWHQVFSQAEELDRILRPADTGNDSTSAGVPYFSLAEVLQILLEFCTNEKVKQHLKAIQANQDAIFRGTEAQRALSLLAAGAPQEEGFYQLSVEPLLDLLKSHCEDERVKELFTKMAASADKLFPVSALPLAAQGVEGEFTEEPSDTQENSEVESRWEELQKTLKLLADQQQAVGDSTPACTGPNKTSGEIKEVIGTVDRITGTLSRIIEALAFQDLSGQRLLKILKIIRELQVQVLTMLIATGHKLQMKLNDQSISPQDMNLAREELDRLISGSAPADGQSAMPSPEEQPLDQNAINELLTTMGF